MAMDRTTRLRSLKSTNESLMQSFRTNIVRVDYSHPEIQNAYLMRYFPIHAKLTLAVLKFLEFNGALIFENSTKIQVSLIGCGPCPEVVGIMEHLSKRHSDTRPVFHAFDLRNSSWEKIRTNTLASVLTGIMPKVYGHTFDLCQKNSADKHANKFAGSQLIVVQNCLNELDISCFENVFENLKQVISLMPVGGRFIAIDIINYKMTKQILGGLQVYFRNKSEYEIELKYSQKINCIFDDDNNNADYPCELSDFQIEKKHRVKYVRLAIRKIR